MQEATDGQFFLLEAHFVARRRFVGDEAHRAVAVAEIVAEHATGTVSVPVPPGPAGYRLVAVELEPARYTRIRLAATPISGEGRIVLRGYRRYALPR